MFCHVQYSRLLIRAFYTFLFLGQQKLYASQVSAITLNHWNDLCRFGIYLCEDGCSVQSLGRVRLFVTPWTSALQASLSISNSKFTQTHVH